MTYEQPRLGRRLVAIRGRPSSRHGKAAPRGLTCHIDLQIPCPLNDGLSAAPVPPLVAHLVPSSRRLLGTYKVHKLGTFVFGQLSDEFYMFPLFSSHSTRC